MTTNSPNPLPQKTAAPVTPNDLKTWLADPDSNAGNILAAVKAGQVKVTTTEALDGLLLKTKHFAQAYADSEIICGELQTDKAILLETLFYLLKSFEGVAAQADKIVQLSAMLGVGEGKVPGLAQLAKNALMNGSKLMELSAPIMHGFNAEILMQIQFERLGPMLAAYHDLDLREYAKLASVFAAFAQKHEQPPQQALPEKTEA